VKFSGSEGLPMAEGAICAVVSVSAGMMKYCQGTETREDPGESAVEVLLRVMS